MKGVLVENAFFGPIGISFAAIPRLTTGEGQSFNTSMLWTEEETHWLMSLWVDSSIQAKLQRNAS